MYVWAVETGGDVIFYHRGSIDTSLSPPSGSWSFSNYIKPQSGEYFGITANPFEYYSNAVPDGSSRSFGSGIGAVSPDFESGDTFLLDAGQLLGLPVGYRSGSRISGSMRFVGTSFATLGVNASFPFNFLTTDGRNTIHFFTEAPPDYTALITSLRRKISKLGRTIRKAKKKKQSGKVRSLKKQVRKLKTRLQQLN